ncbi:SDR family NAD(P)-dependent oxidoreductase [Aspergillus chevalieri]|uniref:Uncharacterized protein n=1 Tax=Aspergillus chevalieri TaxID=182096 RepID=A0A7R7VSQ1_ASPCH|nr:uncharacterized protein ACHE_51288S [Aspergillus chevalieri]BCR90090.1 hypothetical protein ACHE_51288S [Aspergillus chevalieri]
MASMQNKVFAIFGGASGMGLVTARFLLARGARVAVCDISADNLKQLHTSLPTDQNSHCFVQTGSVTDESAVEAFLTKTKSNFGKLNGVANYAGVPGHKLGTEAIWQTSQEEYHFIMDVNIRGLFNVLTASLRPGFL